MVDALLEILEGTGYEAYRQGSFSDESEYPESFFTFWCNDSPDHAHYDNQRYGTVWDFDVNFYSTDPDLAYSELEDVIETLEAAGWTVPSRAYDVRSDSASHVGRGVNIYYLEV